MISKVFGRGAHILTIVALIGFLPNAYATTLREVVQHTVCTNPEVLEWTKIKRASNETVKIAHSRYYPVVDFNFGVGREKSNNSNTGFSSRTLNRRELGLRLRQNIFEGFTTLYEVKRNQAKTDADAYQVQGEAEDQALFATQAYLNILRTKERLAVAQDNLQTHQRIYNMIKKRSSSGVGREADISQATGRLALAQSNVYAAQNELRNAQVDFYRVTGLTSDHLAMPREPSDSLIPNTYQTAMYNALKNHPKMHVAVTDVEEARAQHNVAHATAFPVLDFVVEANNNHNLNGSEGRSNNYLAIFQLNYNLYRGGADVARQRETAYLTQQAAEIRNRTCRETKQNMHLSWNNLQASRSRLPTLYQHKVSSTKTARAYHDQFRLGKRTLLDLLDSENERFRSSEEYIDGKYDILVSKYRILQAMGQLTSYLHVTIPEEGHAEYGFYHPEANPVVVKRHIEARIPETDKPAAWYHKDEPTPVVDHSHHQHTSGSGPYRQISQNKASNPSQVAAKSVNTHHHRRIVYFGKKRQNQAANGSNGQPPQTGKWQNKQTSWNTQQQQTLNSAPQQHTTSAPRANIQATNQPQVTHTRTVAFSKIAPTPATKAAKTVATPKSTASKAIAKNTGVVEADWNKTPAELTTAQRVEQEINAKMHYTPPGAKPVKVVKASAKKAVSKVAAKAKSVKHTIVAANEHTQNGWAHGQQQTSQFDAKPPYHHQQSNHAQQAHQADQASNFHRNQQGQQQHWQQQASFRGHQAQQFNQHANRTPNQNVEEPHVLKEAEGLSTHVPSSQYRHQAQVHRYQPHQHQRYQEVVASTQQSNNQGYSRMTQGAPRQFHNDERRLPHQAQMTSSSHPSFDEKRLARQWEQQNKFHQAKLQPQPKPKAVAQQKQPKQVAKAAINTQEVTKAKVIKSGPELTGWAVQLGTFKDLNEVDGLVVKLRKNGMNGFMREIQSSRGTTFEVFVGPTKKRTEASKLVKKLHNMQLGGSIVRADI